MRKSMTEMSFAKVYPMLYAKAERKGHTKEEVDTITSWLTGYQSEDISRLLSSDISYGDFFRQAPSLNPNRLKITGVICKVRVEEITDPLMRDIRCLDKMVDELARGKAMNKILRE